MPITVTPAPPGTLVGPGIAITLSSDFIGPLPDGSEYQIFITGIPDEFLIWQEHVPWFPGTRTYWLGTQSEGGISLPTTRTVDAGQSVSINVDLVEPTGTVDTGSATATWQPTLGLGAQIALRPQVVSAPSTDPRIDEILNAVRRQLVDQT